MIKKSKIILINLTISFVSFVLTLLLAETLLRQIDDSMFKKNAGLLHAEAPPNIKIQKLSPNEIKQAKNVLSDLTYDRERFDRLNNSRENVSGIYYPGLHTPWSENLKYGIPEKSVTAKEVISVEGETIYNVEYSLDEWRRRKTKSTNKKNKNVLIYGCSYVFGTGVRDDQTIPAYVADMLPEFNVYNYGVLGGSFTGMLDDIKTGHRLTDINKNGGYLVYMFWYDHIPRHFVSLHSLRNQYPTISDFYYETKNGQLLSFNDSVQKNSIKYKALKFLSRSELLYRTGLGYNYYNKHDLAEFLEYLKIIKSFYAKNYNLEFLLVFMSPGDAPSQEFLTSLDKEKISYVVLESIFAYFEKFELLIPKDGHYTPLGNYLYANQIVNSIAEKISNSN